MASVQFSRTVERRITPACDRHLRARSHQRDCVYRRRTPVSQNSTACWGRFAAEAGRAPQVVRETARRAAIQPGSVDMLGPTPLGHHRVSRTRRPQEPGHCYVLPRKEVIQPQLPLRLPCYDFTPVTSPTFDGSLPCGLGHRLRVLLTPVV